MQCAPGLGKTLEKELGYLGAIAREQKVFTRLQRNHDLMFIGRAKDENAFARSRVSEMVLRCPAYGRFKISQRQLGLMADEIKILGPRRLVVNVAGRHFQRQDFGRFLTRELSARGAEIDDGVEDEAWLFCIDEDWYFGLPVRKSRETDGREGRETERHGSLPPTIAAAMAFASHARDEDVVVDPTCGSGSVLAEVHAYAPNARLMGFDIDPSAIKAAAINLKAITGLELKSIDARKAKVDPVSTLMISNLPFGKQFGDRATNLSLYGDLIRQGLQWRDTSKAWRGVFLTSDTQNFESAVKTFKDLKCEVLFKVKIRGELATAFRVTARSNV